MKKKQETYRISNNERAFVDAVVTAFGTAHFQLDLCSKNAEPPLTKEELLEFSLGLMDDMCNLLVSEYLRGRLIEKGVVDASRKCLCRPDAKSPNTVVVLEKTQKEKAVDPSSL